MKTEPDTPARPLSLAIESTCRAGGVALGAGEALVEVLAFDAGRRAAMQVVAHADALCRRHGVEPADLDELYVSTGPGSFTGTRVGVTVVRTLAQAIQAARPQRGPVACVGVPTVLAVAENAQALPEVRHLAVVLDARHGRVWWARFERGPDGRLAAASPGQLATPEELLAAAPRPLHLVGEGLGYYAIEAQSVERLPESLWLPRAEGVWAVGRRLAATGRATGAFHVLPIYTGPPEAVRKWEQRRQ